MSSHAKFTFDSPEKLKESIAALGLDIRLQDDLSPLARPVALGPVTAPNSLVIHPMEGCDGEADGSPSDLVRRRYMRFAGGGAGLIWFEATAVVPEARANPRQLWIHQDNADQYASMLRNCLVEAEQRPVTVIQLTHSGRYSCCGNSKIAYHHPHLPRGASDAHVALFTDEEIEAIEDKYVEAARLARQAGFDGVDIKHCHRYLGNELLSAYTRTGRYGGSYENRTRFLKNVVAKVRAAVPDLMVTTRLNVYDGIPHPYGFGMASDGSLAPDLTEPIRLVQELRAMGMSLINLTLGNPYYNPHIGRPFDQSILGGYQPDEHPLEGVARALRLVRQVQQAVPDIAVVGTGYSWLRQFVGMAGAASIANGWTTMVGLGRLAFAHPGFAQELLGTGKLARNKVCISCSKCTQLMRDGTVTGCVPHDPKIYLPIYNAAREGQPAPPLQPVVGGHY